eukprot:gene10190-11276_t
MESSKHQRNTKIQCASGDDLLCEMFGCEIRRSRYSAGTDICLHLRISGTRLYELKFPLDREGDIDLSNLNQYRVPSAVSAAIFQPAIFP